MGTTCFLSRQLRVGRMGHVPKRAKKWSAMVQVDGGQRGVCVGLSWVGAWHRLSSAGLQSRGAVVGLAFV